MADAEGVDAQAAAIEFEDVLLSVERHFPLILAANEEIEIAEASLVQARGGFDTKLKGLALTEPEGFFESERVKVDLEQPTTLWGATFRGGYKLGRGTFDDFDGEAQTNDDGEVSAGINVPLLQGRAIDPRRVELWTARLKREQADPKILKERLKAMQKAASAYWKWVAAGRLREVALRLLALARDRESNLQIAVDAGKLAEISLVQNRRLVVDRETSLARAELVLQEAAINLSLYWRDENGQPRVPRDEELPYEFPLPREVDKVILEDDEKFALSQRPEIRAIELKLQGLEVQQEAAENTLLPQLNFDLFASQDSGEASSDPDDKGDFELTALLTLDVPLQRRKAKGKVRQIRAKTIQLTRESQFLIELIVSEVQAARAALAQSWVQIAQAQENVRLANEIAEAERFQLSVGGSDLIRVNIVEADAAKAASGLIKVLNEYFVALTNYRAVLGIPYDQY